MRRREIVLLKKGARVQGGRSVKAFKRADGGMDCIGRIREYVWKKKKGGALARGRMADHGIYQL